MNRPTMNADQEHVCRPRQLHLVANLIALVCIIASTAVGNDQIPGVQPSGPIVIRGATLHPIDQAPIERGMLLIDEGRIAAIGTDIDVPKDAREISAEGQHVYPGLIDSMTDLGLREITAVDVTVDSDEMDERNPNVRSWIAVNPDSELIPVARAGGVLVAHVSPIGRLLRGQTAVMQLDGWTASEMNVLAPAGLSIDWESLMPNDDDVAEQAKKRREKMTELTAYFESARRYDAARQGGQIDDITDVRLESMRIILHRDRPIFVRADDEFTIRSAVSFAVKQNLDMVICGGYDAESCADLLRTYKIPVIIGGTYRLPRRRGDPYDAPYTLAARLQSAGISYAIAGEGAGYPGGSSNARNLPYHAANAAAYGLSPEDAIRAVTLAPAEILGVADRLGSLTAGKLATLFLCNGDILQTETNLTAAFISGRPVDLSSKHTELYEKYKRKYESQ